MTNLMHQLAVLAATAEAHGEAAVRRNDHAQACDLFRVMEAADALFLALTESADVAAGLELAA